MFFGDCSDILDNQNFLNFLSIQTVLKLIFHFIIAYKINSDVIFIVVVLYLNHFV